MYNIDQKYEIIHIPESRESHGWRLITVAYVMATPNTPVYDQDTTMDCWIFEYITKGAGYLEIDGKLEHLHAGDAFMLPERGCPYRFWHDPQDPWNKLVVHATGSTLESLVRFYDIGNNHIIHNNLSMRDIFMEFLQLSHDLSTANRKSLMLFHKMIEKWQTPGQNRQTHSIEAAVKLKVYLDNTVYKKFSLQDYAANRHVSSEHLIRVFKQAYQKTPYTYLCEQRLGIAKNMLQFTNDPLKIIAERLCFTDPYHFSKVFKKYIGMAPSEYRNIMRTKSKAR